MNIDHHSMQGSSAPRSLGWQLARPAVQESTRLGPKKGRSRTRTLSFSWGGGPGPSPSVDLPVSLLDLRAGWAPKEREERKRKGGPMPSLGFKERVALRD